MGVVADIVDPCFWNAFSNTCGTSGKRMAVAPRKCRVLVTGASGFIGTYLVQHLVDQGHEVHILCRATSDVSDLPVSIHKHVGDVTDMDSLMAACAGVDTVFHLAASIGYKPTDRPLMQRVNVVGTRFVMQVCVCGRQREGEREREESTHGFLVSLSAY